MGDSRSPSDSQDRKRKKEKKDKRDKKDHKDKKRRKDKHRKRSYSRSRSRDRRRRSRTPERSSRWGERGDRDRRDRYGGGGSRFSGRDERDGFRFDSPPKEENKTNQNLPGQNPDLVQSIAQALPSNMSLPASALQKIQQPESEKIFVPQPGKPITAEEAKPELPTGDINQMNATQLQMIINNQIQTAQQPGGQQAQPSASSEISAQQIYQQLQVVRAQQELATSKADRKVYVGNIPPTITTNVLTEVLNSALKQMNVNQEQGDSIVSSWISPDQHYSFVEFKTPQEATNALNAFQQGDIKLYGQPIKVGRPKQYLQQTSAIEASANTNTVSLPGIPGEQMPIMQQQQPGVPNTFVPRDKDGHIIKNSLLQRLNPLGCASIYDGATCGVSDIKCIQVPTRVLVLKNLFAEEELIIDEEFDDIYKDVKEECAKFGVVLNLIFPRPKPEEEINKDLGHGIVFCRFSTKEEAVEARIGLQGRMYGNRTIGCSYLSEEKFNKEDFKLPIV